MKIIYIFFSVLILLIGCKKETTTNVDLLKSYSITVDFQDGFNNDSAVIFMDEEVIASVDSITTDPIIAAAASRKFTISPGTHTLSVVIPKYSERTDTTFIHVEKNLWIGVNYSGEKRGIILLFQYSPFPYR